MRGSRLQDVSLSPHREYVQCHRWFCKILSNLDRQHLEWRIQSPLIRPAYRQLPGSSYILSCSVPNVLPCCTCCHRADARSQSRYTRPDQCWGRILSMFLQKRKYQSCHISHSFTQWKWSCSKMYFCLSGPPIKYGLLFRLGNVIIAEVLVLTISAHPPTLSQCPTNSKGFDASSNSASRSWSAMGDWTGSVDIFRELFVGKRIQFVCSSLSKPWMRTERQIEYREVKRSGESKMWNLISNNWNDKNSIRAVVKHTGWTYLYRKIAARIWKINPFKYWERQFINF